MAIIEDLKGIEVTVRVQGITTEEFDDPSFAEQSAFQRQPNAVSKYIECRYNEEFVVNCKVTKEYAWGFKNHSLNIAVALDGKWVKGELCRQYFTWKKPWECEVSYRAKKGQYGFGWQAQYFKFSRISEVIDAEPERISQDKENVKSLGNIDVRVYRVLEGAERSDQKPSTMEPTVELSKESLKGKAISVGADFGKTTRITAPRYTKCHNLRDDTGPIASFRFKYRTREDLVREGVIPRKPVFGTRLAGVSRLSPGRMGNHGIKASDQAKQEHGKFDKALKNLPGPVSKLPASDAPPPWDTERESIFDPFKTPKRPRHAAASRSAPRGVITINDDDADSARTAQKKSQNTTGPFGRPTIVLDEDRPVGPEAIRKSITKHGDGSIILIGEDELVGVGKERKISVKHGSGSTTALDKGKPANIKQEIRGVIKHGIGQVVDLDEDDASSQILRDLRRVFEGDAIDGMTIDPKDADEGSELRRALKTFIREELRDVIKREPANNSVTRQGADGSTALNVDKENPDGAPLDIGQEVTVQRVSRDIVSLIDRHTRLRSAGPSRGLLTPPSSVSRASSDAVLNTEPGHPTNPDRPIPKQEPRPIKREFGATIDLTTAPASPSAQRDPKRVRLDPSNSSREVIDLS